MMKKRILVLGAFLALLATLLSSCGAYAPKGEIAGPDGAEDQMNFAPDAPAEEVEAKPEASEAAGDDEGPRKILENSFVDAAVHPVSTFSADVDTASYSLFRRLVQKGYTLEELKATAGGCLRTEEMVNYFSYTCPEPTEGIFGIKATVAPSPYNDTTLLMLTLATQKTESSKKNNLVFLIDVSGSMMSEDKLPLLKKAFSYLVGRLDGDDTVSIVTYSGKEEVVLDGCSGSKSERILQAVNGLSAGGSTNGEAGLKMAYRLAEAHYIPNGNNRIFLASDGDLNVGASSVEEVRELVSEKKKSGVYLSVLGFGEGNYRDDMMESIADNGNGVYHYVDSDAEAEKIFGEDLFANLYPVADDVKLQLTFRPEVVAQYRLVGYENRILSEEDFKDDQKDAGELGAGHCVTVFYELKLRERTEESAELPFAELAIRWKEPGETKSKEKSFTLEQELYTENPDEDFLFATAVVECSALLRDSAYKGNASFENIQARLAKLNLEKDFYKEQFAQLLDTLIKNSSPNEKFAAI
ncbi:MAG: von Willebrand factor type A domain-containing protein [Clostridiales bacterium]|nr:von Willebrand factor type A domain-containing protein [Clostridiales bacterium]